MIRKFRDFCRPVLTAVKYDKSFASAASDTMSERALRKGESLTPADFDVMRLYSMRFCPYAQRTRIVLLHKKIPHETINVNLKHKPDWFVARNPLGLVPILEYRGQIVYESSVCDEYLDDIFPDHGEGRLMPESVHERAADNMIMRLFDAKIPPSIYGLLRPERQEKARATMAFGLKILEDRLGPMKFFGGDKPSMVDFHVFPWFERFPANRKTSLLTGQEYDPLPASEYPNLVRWFENIKKLPAVRDTMYPDEYHMEFFASFARKDPAYDIGLQVATTSHL